MKSNCHDNNGAAIYMLEGLRPCTFLCFNIHNAVAYFNRNVSIGQLLQHISKSIVVCARSGPKMLTKTYNKEGFITIAFY